MVSIHERHGHTPFLAPRDYGPELVSNSYTSLIFVLVHIMSRWSTSFLEPLPANISNRALIILNQPFSTALVDRLWNACEWRCCADGGANRLYDLFEGQDIEDGHAVREL